MSRDEQSELARLRALADKHYPAVEIRPATYADALARAHNAGKSTGEGNAMSWARWSREAMRLRKHERSAP